MPKTIEEVLAMQRMRLVVQRRLVGLQEVDGIFGLQLDAVRFFHVADGHQHGKTLIPILGLPVVGKIRRYGIRVFP